MKYIYRVSHEICLSSLLWSEKFGISSRKCAPVGKIKSFINKSGLRISKFQSICSRELLSVLGYLAGFSEKASKKIFKRHFWAYGAKIIFETKLFWLALTHHFVSCPKKNFWTNLKIWPKILLSESFWNLKILKNPFCHQMWDFRYWK